MEFLGAGDSIEEVIDWRISISHKGGYLCLYAICGKAKL